MGEAPSAHARLFVTDDDITSLPCFANDTVFAIKVGFGWGGRGGLGLAVTLGLRPDRLALAAGGPAHAVGRVTLVEHLGDETILHLRVDAATSLTMKLQGDVALRIGDAVGARFDLTGARLFGADGLALAG